MQPPPSRLDVTKLEAACSFANLVSVMPICLPYEGDLSWYKIMMYKILCLKENVLPFGNNK